MIIVAGVDASDHARNVLKRAIEEAKAKNAELHAVHVVQIPIYFDFPVDVAALEAKEREMVWNSLDAAINEAGIPIRKVDLTGYPPDVLVDHAVQTGASLLVIGTRGHGEFASLIMGSTSHRALHLAPCDVLVVKPAQS